VVLNGVRGSEVLRLSAKAGTKLKLDAGASRDPDGQRLRFEWFHYPEPGTYHGQVQIEGTGTSVATVHVPVDAGGKSFHVIVAVTDEGNPPLTRYRRAVIEVSNAAL
jgi:hypothetical protein